MHKSMYDRLVTEYSKESKEELVQRIMSLDEIECSDRCFANQCEAGTAIYNINELFNALDTLKDSLDRNDVTADERIEMFKNIFLVEKDAKGSFEYIKKGLSEINDPSRCGNNLDNLKKRILNAKDVDDVI